MSIAEELPEEERTDISDKSLSEFTGSEKAAILLMSLGSDFGKPIWDELDDDEVIAVSLAMSKLGGIEKETVEAMLGEFISQMSLAGAVIGSTMSTERLLAQYLPKERLTAIMEEIRGPAGRNMWEKLANVQAHVLANYMKNEYPQTVAVVLTKIPPDHSARVLSLLPDEFAMEVVQRMLAMDRCNATSWKRSNRPFEPNLFQISRNRESGMRTN